MSKNQHVFFTQLKSPISTIDGMAAGEFRDMSGHVFAWKKNDLPLYVENTKKALASTTDATGQLVGFPIDSMDHDHNVAAGWIKDVELDSERDVVKFSVEWNELGKGLIGSNQMRYFSPELDLIGKAIIGGSLTNWPASRNKDNEILLKPVTLSMGMFSLEPGESLDERSDQVRMAFYQEYAEYDYNSWPVEVFEGYLICHKDDKYWKAQYSIDSEGSVIFDTSDLWTEVKRSWIELSLEKLQRVFSGLSKKAGSPIQNTEDDMDFDKLPQEQQTALLSAAKGQVIAELAKTDTLPPELAKLVDARASEQMTTALALEKRKAHVAQFSARVVGGTQDKAEGLPVGKENLETLLLSLTQEQQDKVEELLTAVLTKGVVPFKELGHSKEGTGKQELPEYAKLSLKKFLDAGFTVERFFKENAAELGDQSDYELSEFQAKE